MIMIDTEFFPPSSGPLASLTRPIAVLRLLPNELQSRTGIRFQPAHDDLDALDWARVAGLSGKSYALVCHRNAPQPGTEIVTRYDSPNPRADVLDVLKALELSTKDLIWTAPEASPVRNASVTAARGKRRNVAGRGNSELKWRLNLSPDVVTQLRKVEGRGRFQELLRTFQKRVRGAELPVTPSDFERLLTYSAQIGAVSVSRPARARTSKRASKKK